MSLLKLFANTLHSMARAILKRNKILFMDEATASIDCTFDFPRKDAMLICFFDTDETDVLSKLVAFPLPTPHVILMSSASL